MSQGRLDTRILVAGTIITLAAIAGFVAMTMELREDFAIPALIAIGAVSFAVFRGPIGKAMARRLEHGPAVPEVSVETQGELEDLRARMFELEERLDFTERMLSKAREPERLSEPRT